MITGLLITLFTGFINFVLGLLPSGGLNAAVNTNLQNFFQYVYQYNGFFPVDTALTLLGWSVGFWLLVFLFDFLKWLIHLIRGN